MLLCSIRALVLPVALVLSQHQTFAQTTTATAVPSQTTLDLSQVEPATIAARVTAVQDRLRVLQPTDPEKDPNAEERSVLQDILTTLTQLDEAWQKHAQFTTLLKELPERLRTATSSTDSEERRRPQALADVTEELREQYETQLQNARDEVRRLMQDNVSGEVRLATIPQEIEHAIQQRLQSEKEQAALRESPAGNATVVSSLRADLLSLRLRLYTAVEEALDAEREWLVKRVPLQDALVRSAQLRFQRLQRDLNRMYERLGQSVKAEQQALDSLAASLAQQMEQPLDPIDAAVLRLTLDTVTSRGHTAAYRQERTRVQERILEQEQKNTQLQQRVERLTALVEKYTRGDIAAQQVPALFERIRRERASYRPTIALEWDARLREINSLLFALDDRLYEFDEHAQTILAKIDVPQATPEVQHQEAGVTKVHAVLDEQRSVLREQQQALAQLSQGITRLLLLDREYHQQLDDTYVSTLGKIFWLRDGHPFDLQTATQVPAGLWASLQRLTEFLWNEYARLGPLVAAEPAPWLFLPLIFLLLAWVAYRLRSSLRTQVDLALSSDAARAGMPGLLATVLVVLRSVVWPGYVFLLGWAYHAFVVEQREVAAAILGGTSRAVFLLWLYFFGRQLFRWNGWGQQMWGLSTDVCSTLRYAVTAGAVAAMVCLVPRYVLLVSPGDPNSAPASLALARTLLLVFQSVLIAILARSGRRNSVLMHFVLRGLQQHLIAPLWPLVHVSLLLGLAAISLLDILGYRYASAFLWWRVVVSLAVIALLRLVTSAPLPKSIDRVISRMVSQTAEDEADVHSIPLLVERYRNVATMVRNGVLIVLSLAILLEVWGASLSDLLTSPAIVRAASTAVVIGITVGIAFAVLYVSRTLTAYVLRSRTTDAGEPLEISRKRKTLTPLIQTIIRVLTVFIAVLVILEQIGVATGPLLASVGIFGLAIGFASQSLIKDVINGLFILFEESLSVGDVVEVNSISGQVERFSLRTVTLRDLSGNVYVIPNSTIDVVKNFTQDYSRYLLDVGVAYREDVDAVIAVLQEIAEGLRGDPLYGQDILEPLEVLGLDRFEDSAVIIRARLTTRPLQQWRVGREFNRRMKKVFDERGIEIPFPQRTIYWGTQKETPASPPQGPLPPSDDKPDDKQ